MRSVHADEPLVTVFASRTHRANLEAEVIRSLLGSAGISCWIARENVIQQPVGNVLVKVLRSQADDARSLIDGAVAGASRA